VPSGRFRSVKSARTFEAIGGPDVTARQTETARVKSRAVSVAFAGTGGIAGIHARALSSLPPGTAALVAATDTEPARLATFAQAHGVPATYTTLARLLAGARPDLVHVCTPPSTHHAIALACLRAGASVLVEKPPAISVRELDEITAAQGPDGGPPWFATVFQHRFGGGHRRLAALARRGADGPLGRPLLAACHTTWFRDQAYFDVPWRGRWETEGGGPTMGHGIHQMDMLLDILGDWTRVSAVAATLGRRTRTEDVSLAHVTFASGAIASVVNSVLSPREESYLRFDFEHASVEVTHLYGYADADWRVTPAPGHDDVRAAWREAGANDDGVHGGSVHGYGVQGDGVHDSAGDARSGHAGQFREVVAALRGHARPPVSPADARRTMTLIAGIYASAFTGRPVIPADLAPGTPFYESMNGGARR
jgi:predicted dehydrogenase